jgi:hypothetical protein
VAAAEVPKEESSEEEEVLTEDSIRAMAEEDLRALLSANGVEAPADLHETDLADWVVNEFSS